MRRGRTTGCFLHVRGPRFSQGTPPANLNSCQRPRGVRTLRVRIVGEYVQIRGTSERASMATFAGDELLVHAACRPLPPNKPSAFLDGGIKVAHAHRPLQAICCSPRQERARTTGPRGGWWLRTRKAGCAAEWHLRMHGGLGYLEAASSIVSVRI